ncbi:MAG: hypothetical protein A4E58_01397 [Syntrophorhabdus sp. PtaB.Bin006]|nr:MAG: hypothetical protein A4E58_01397 [Syntrophorhabdus sp. PtaB.Bin006]
MDPVEFGKLPVIVIGRIGHEFLLGLFAEVLRVHKEEDPIGTGIFEETVDGSDGGKGFARTGGHLNEGLGLVSPEGVFKVVNGRDLTVAKAGGRQGGDIEYALPQ